MRAQNVWIGEGRYASIWYTLFTTCRLYKREAKDALDEHPSRQEFDEVRVTKFVRDSRPKGERKGE